ncbi:MAG: Cu(I)-responsive transcriptional regulator [Rhodobiaceae bacterium]|nr:Cu(I)-responsive transcriptional regulator [Rhodobiaceae bacterium]
MKIGTLAERAGLSTKTIRYYEKVGLIDPPPRTEGGYRSYTDDDIDVLRFVARARGLGFSVKECKALLTLYSDRSRASADVKALALAHIEEVDRKIKELQSIRNTLGELATKCHGDDRPDCPIIEELSNMGEAR